MLATIVLAESSGGLGINIWAFVSQLISFLVVLFLLWKWVFPIATKTLEERQARIREGLTNAEKAQHDLEDAGKRAEQILAEARKHAQETIERATKNAEQVAHQIEDEARARAEQINQQNIARIQQEVNRARMELSRDVVNLSIDAASRVISRSVDTKDNRRLVEEFVSSSDNARNN
jgi:F-type H+-transporting ATPase subunit b